MNVHMNISSGFLLVSVVHNMKVQIKQRNELDSSILYQLNVGNMLLILCVHNFAIFSFNNFEEEN